MKKRLLTAVLAFTLILGALPLYAAGNEARTITIFNIEGDDVRMTKGTPREFDARIDTRLAEGHTVSTGIESFAYFRMDTDSLLKMDQRSMITVGKASRNKLSISVLSGNALMDAGAQSADNVIETRVGNTGMVIRGTLYVIGQDTHTKRGFITMLDGSGSVEGAGPEEILLQAGKTISFNQARAGTGTQYTLEDIDVSKMNLFSLHAVWDNSDLLLQSGVISADDMGKLPALIEVRQSEMDKLPAPPQISKVVYNSSSAIPTPEPERTAQRTESSYDYAPSPTPAPPSQNTGAPFTACAWTSGSTAVGPLYNLYAYGSPSNKVAQSVSGENYTILHAYGNDANGNYININANEVSWSVISPASGVTLTPDSNGMRLSVNTSVPVGTYVNVKAVSVANPSFDADISVQVSPPTLAAVTNLRLGQPGGTGAFVNLMFDAPTNMDGIEFYTVEYRKDGGDWHVNRISWLNPGPNSIVLSGFNETGVYEFRVATTDKHDWAWPNPYRSEPTGITHGMATCTNTLTIEETGNPLAINSAAWGWVKNLWDTHSNTYRIETNIQVADSGPGQYVISLEAYENCDGYTHSAWGFGSGNNGDITMPFFHYNPEWDRFYDYSSGTVTVQKIVSITGTNNYTMTLTPKQTTRFPIAPNRPTTPY
jgi:hypothetical protein